MYAENLKLFQVVNSPLDALNLQIDLYAIQEWSEAYELSLNIVKCQIISFSQSQICNYFDYMLHYQTLVCVDTIPDLEILLDSNLNFGPHLEYASAKALKSVGFISRTIREFKSVSAVLHLYKALVIPSLFSGAIIWSPHTKWNTAPLHRFLRFVSY